MKTQISSAFILIFSGLLFGCGLPKESGGNTACADSQFLGTWKSGQLEITVTKSCGVESKACGKIMDYYDRPDGYGVILSGQVYDDSSGACQDQSICHLSVNEVDNSKTDIVCDMNGPELTATLDPVP